MSSPFQPTGKVILAGAGPGDPDLISVKALRYLQCADVVIVDRLVSEELLISNVKPGARIIQVGKQGRSLKSTDQQTINDLLVEQASGNALVMRLKGGDVSFFSNVLDELETLTKHKIPFEIVPGITSASGAAAYAGIPLTARGYSASVRFLTHFGNLSWSKNYWNELAKTDDTLVFYMSLEFLETLVNGLLDNGISDEKQLAIISEATTPAQRVLVLPLKTYLEKKEGIRLISPSIIIVGKVTALHEKYKWFKNGFTDSGHFKSLDQERIPVNLNVC